MIERLIEAAFALVTSAAGETIYLTQQPCRLTDRVENLPYAAAWVEDGAKYEGCWALINGIVVAYWTDRTVTAVPAQYARRSTRM